MKTQFDKLINLAKQYKAYGTSIFCREGWLEVYGFDTDVLDYPNAGVGYCAVETCFAIGDRYETFCLRVKLGGKEILISDYNSKIQIPFDVTKGLLDAAIDKLTNVLTLWKEHTANADVAKIEEQRQLEIDDLQQRLDYLKNSGTVCIAKNILF